MFDLNKMEMVLKMHPHALQVTVVVFSSDGRSQVFTSTSKRLNRGHNPSKLRLCKRLWVKVTKSILKKTYFDSNKPELHLFPSSKYKGFG